MAATARTNPTSFEVGSTLIAPSTKGPADPAGTTHLVEGWQPVCGGDRVRFVFPGRLLDAATCPDCVEVAQGSGASVPAVAAVPRQRTAARTTAGRAGSKAS